MVATPSENRLNPRRNAHAAAAIAEQGVIYEYTA
jgi:hypothetical protein